MTPGHILSPALQSRLSGEEMHSMLMLNYFLQECLKWKKTIILAEIIEIIFVHAYVVSFCLYSKYWTSQNIDFQPSMKTGIPVSV